MKTETQKSDQMRATLADWKESGLSLLAFVEREGLAYAKLLYWKKKFRDEDAAASSRIEAKTSFAPVQVHVACDAAERKSPSVMSIWLPNGITFEAPTSVGEADLARAIRVLSEC